MTLRSSAESHALIGTAAVIRRAVRPIVLSFAIVAGGCTTRVEPPADAARPVTVALLDHGRHASLVVQTADDRMVRYAYGDWRWYALEDTGVWQGIAALFWPTQGALGRKYLAGPLTREALAREVRIPIEEAFTLEVEADRAKRLMDELDRIFRDNQTTLTDNRTYDLAFVHHPAPYSIINTSNRMTVRWLEQLGCRVDGTTVLSDWALEDRAS